jgi:hypothetical protein
MEAQFCADTYMHARRIGVERCKPRPQETKEKPSSTCFRDIVIGARSPGVHHVRPGLSLGVDLTGTRVKADLVLTSMIY